MEAPSPRQRSPRPSSPSLPSPRPVSPPVDLGAQSTSRLSAYVAGAVLVALVLVAVVVAAVFVRPSTAPAASSVKDARDMPDDGLSGWTNWGHDLWNWRNALLERTINPSNVANLQQKWVFNANGGVSAAPTGTGVDNLLYVTDWAGMLTCLNSRTGAVVWQYDVGSWIRAHLTGAPAAFDAYTEYVSRSSPAIFGNQVFIATRAGAYVLAFNRLTGGAPIWSSRVETHPWAIITSSPRIWNGAIYVGVSSDEEIPATDSAYTCCTFRGSAVALDLRTGRKLWQTYTVPATAGWSGGAIWSSLAPIDVARSQIFFTTGNAYTVPAAVSTCLNLTSSNRNLLLSAPCRAPGDYSDAVIALDLATGHVRWAMTAASVDAWNAACGYPFEGYPFAPQLPWNCPPVPGTDYDFAQAPMFVPGSPNTPDGQDTLYVGQKSGIFWAISAQSGKVQWARYLGPGGPTGGFMFGSTTDGTVAYYANANSNAGNHTLPNGQVTTTSWWGAISLKDGRILWETPSPYPFNLLIGSLTLANGVIYSGVEDVSLWYGGATEAHLFAIKASNGQILQQWSVPYIFSNGPSVINSVVYWPIGYQQANGADPTGQLLAYGL